MADQLLNALSVINNPAAGSIVYIVTDPDGTPGEGRLALSELAANMPTITVETTGGAGNGIKIKSTASDARIEFVPAAAQASNIYFWQDDGVTEDARINAPEGQQELRVYAGGGLQVTVNTTGVAVVGTFTAGTYTGQSSIVTVGVLNSGSIGTSFGNIDIGSSTFDTTGAVTTGAITVAGSVIVSKSLVGIHGLDIVNTSTDTSATARLFIDAKSTGNGDAYILLRTANTVLWSLGIDNGSSDSFKISQSGGLGSNDFLIITTAGAATFSGTLNATGAVTFDSTLSAGVTTIKSSQDSDYFDEGLTITRSATSTHQITLNVVGGSANIISEHTSRIPIRFWQYESTGPTTTRVGTIDTNGNWDTDGGSLASGNLTVTGTGQFSDVVTIDTGASTASLDLRSTGQSQIVFGEGATDEWVIYRADADNTLRFREAGVQDVLTFAPGTALATFAGAGSFAEDLNVLGSFRVGDSTTPTAYLDVKASTTSRASIRIRVGVDPASLNDGDVWNDGTDLFFRKGGATYTIDMTAV